MMKNLVIFPPLGLVRSYQVKCALLLTIVPVACITILIGVMLLLGQLNIYFLENSGLIVSEEIRQAYHDQVQIELSGVAWFPALLFFLTFGISFLVMSWAVSPFVNAEKALRKALADSSSPLAENDWMSESPAFHHAIWNLAKRSRDPSVPFDKVAEAKYRFNLQFFLKFVFVFYSISLVTSYVSGILLNTAYGKIINMAITLVRMKDQGHYFLAQEQILRVGVNVMLVVSALSYAIIGYYITRYMSNMLFVFTRALKEHHFPLKLRHSDIYHGLADAISKAANAAGLKAKPRD